MKDTKCLELFKSKFKTKLFSEAYHWYSTNLLYTALSRHCSELVLYKYSYSFIHIHTKITLYHTKNYHFYTQCFFSLLVLWFIYNSYYYAAMLPCFLLHCSVFHHVALFSSMLHVFYLIALLSTTLPCFPPHCLVFHYVASFSPVTMFLHHVSVFSTALPWFSTTFDYISTLTLTDDGN